jgi:hypothetical protein
VRELPPTLTDGGLRVLAHLLNSTAVRNKRTSADAICNALAEPLGEVNPPLYELLWLGLVDHVESGRNGGPLRWRISDRGQARLVLAANGVLPPTVPAGPRLRPSALAFA